ncbi:unnamed protein product [Cylicostephanus goldi]|uniref:BTB domain-containing protein n=1 Tax=Cylicostephanus goldi TaxID=71465 RepID=A0A3P6RR43_CYLGO|nr:unnamed protein product [Cylicostephanus goldi]
MLVTHLGGDGYWASHAFRRFMFVFQQRQELRDEELVRINVGGTVFEAYRSTLHPLLSRINTGGRRNLNQEYVFVNRNPKHFLKILDYLRDRNNFRPPSEYRAREELRQEAIYYNLADLQRMCAGMLNTRDRVRFKENAIEIYWNYIATFWIQSGLVELNCLDCKSETLVRGSGLGGGGYYVSALHMKQHMLLAKGTIAAVSHINMH